MLPQIRKFIENHAIKRDMMRGIAEFWPRGTEEYIQLEKAYDDGFRGHRDQIRDRGERYFRHVLAVVSILLFLTKKGFIEPNQNLIIAGFLHDLLEDKPQKWTYTAIREKYGSEVAKLVRSVTKPDYDKYGGKNQRHAKATIRKIKKGGYLAIVLKLADRLHNMLTLWGTPEKKDAKIKETVRYYLAMADKVEILYYELLQASAMQSRSRHKNDNEASEVGYD